MQYFGLEVRATEMLLQIGLTANLKGYRYLRRAILIAVMNESAIHMVTKAIYPEIAKEFNVNSIGVERAMRHAIEKAWNNGNLEILYQYFGNSINAGKGKPTNSEFIAVLADRLRFEMCQLQENGKANSL